MLTRRDIARDAYENLVFRLRGSTDAGTDAIRERVSEMLEGAKVRDLQRLSGGVLAGVLPRLYPRMLELAYEHQDAGRPIFICTAAAQEMAELMAIVLTFDGAVGSVAEVIDGVYTGREGGPFNYREGKAQAIRELAEREGIDLAASYAYSDSESDLPMLRLVGHPVAVNPDKELARVARAEGWEIMRFERLGRTLRVAAAAARRRRVRGATGGAHMSLHELTDDQREIRDLTRRFADEKIAPLAAAVGSRPHLPARAVHRAGRARADGRVRAGGARRRWRGLPRLHARARGALARRRGRRRDRRRAHERRHAADPQPRHARADRRAGAAARVAARSSPRSR